MSITLKYESDDNEALLIHEIARQFKVCFDRRASHLKLTRSQWHVLWVLRRNPGITQSHIAEIMEMKPISLCRILDRMEKTGWIERKPSKTDRRANSVILTNKVKPILDEMRACSSTLRKEALKGFKENEHKQLLGFLRRMKLNVSEIISEGN